MASDVADRIEHAIDVLTARVESANYEPGLSFPALTLGLDVTANELADLTQSVGDKFGKTVHAGVIWGVCIGLYAAQGGDNPVGLSD